MSNYLTLCQDAERECSLSSLLTAVASQTGEHLRFVNWVKSAYIEIQNRHNGQWRWLRRSFTFNTTSGDDTYAYGDITDVDAAAVITRFGNWLAHDWEDRYRCYLTSGGVGVQYYLNYLDWVDFKAIYKTGSQNNSAPAFITVDPQNNLILGPQPDDTYTVTGEYMRSAQLLAADGDTPEMPSQFHGLIVARAMEKYALTESAEEVLVRARGDEKRLMRQLEANQLPAISVAGPMA